MKINKYFLSIILAFFSVPALGYGNAEIQGGGYHSGNSRSSKQKKEISRLKKELEQKTAFGERMADAIVRKDQEISNLKKEVEQKTAFGERIADAIGRKDQEISNLKKEVKQYKGDYFQCVANLDSKTREYDGVVQSRKSCRGKLSELAESCSVQPDSKSLLVCRNEKDKLKSELEKLKNNIHISEPQIVEYVPGAPPVAEPDMFIDPDEPYRGPTGAVK